MIEKLKMEMQFYIFNHYFLIVNIRNFSVIADPLHSFGMRIKIRSTKPVWMKAVLYEY